MCTVTAHKTKSGWRVTMNRDEARARADGTPPFSWRTQDLIAPQDPTAGGTWIGVRSDGVWACLLNGYLADGTARHLTAPQTRGRLITGALAAASPDRWLRAAPLDTTHAFRLWVGNDTGLTTYFWDQRRLTVTPAPPADWHFATSSSVTQDRIKAVRQAVFDAFVARGGPLAANGVPTVHLDPAGLPPTEAIRMARPLSHTKSITQIITGKDQISMAHWAEGGFDDAPGTLVRF